MQQQEDIALSSLILIKAKNFSTKATPTCGEKPKKPRKRANSDNPLTLTDYHKQALIGLTLSRCRDNRSWRGCPTGRGGDRWSVSWGEINLFYRASGRYRQCDSPLRKRAGDPIGNGGSL